MFRLFEYEVIKQRKGERIKEQRKKQRRERKGETMKEQKEKHLKNKGRNNERTNGDTLKKQREI
jgi:hypothetical protein